MKLTSPLILATLLSCEQHHTTSSPQIPVAHLKTSELTLPEGIPALGVALIKDNELEVSISGVKIFGTKSPFLSSDSFHLGSCTKAMTATLAAILIEEGKLGWTSKLKDLIPSLEMHPEYAGVTFEMLLSHRSGLIADGGQTFSDNWLYKNLQTTSTTPREARIFYAQTTLPLKPESIPGTTFNYHNGNYMIAAMILEELTGESWESLIQEKLFIPLNMKSCGTGATWGHIWNGSQVVSMFADNPPAFNPASGVHCTMEDWGKFLQEHLKGLRNEPGIVSAESFEKLHKEAADDGHNYTYGAWVKRRPLWSEGPVLWHNGSNTWNYAQVFIAPHKNAIVMSATNIGGHGAEIATDEAIDEFVKSKL